MKIKKIGLKRVEKRLLAIAVSLLLTSAALKYPEFQEAFAQEYTPDEAEINYGPSVCGLMMEEYESTIPSVDVQSEETDDEELSSETVEEEPEDNNCVEAFITLPNDGCVIPVVDSMENGAEVGFIQVNSVVTGIDHGDFVKLDEMQYVEREYLIPFTNRVVMADTSRQMVDKEFTIYSPVVSNSGLTIDEIDYLLEDSWLSGYSYLFYNCEKIGGINAYYSLAVSWTESHWGESDIGYTLNNYFGITSRSGYRQFADRDSCMEYWEELMQTTYIAEGRDTPISIGKVYCDEEWAYVVVQVMGDLRDKVSKYREGIV